MSPSRPPFFSPTLASSWIPTPALLLPRGICSLSWLGGRAVSARPRLGFRKDQVWGGRKEGAPQGAFEVMSLRAAHVEAPGWRGGNECQVQTEGGQGETDSYPGGGEKRAASGW